MPPMISIADYLSDRVEECPSWLLGYRKGDRVPMDKILGSRVVYYPGAGDDGQPVHTFSKAHFAHVYLFVDYLREKEAVRAELMADGAFKGYDLLDIREVSEIELTPKHFVYHVRPQTDPRQYSIQKPFCFLAIYERKKSFGPDHGVDRFAFIYLCADAIATYDAVFANYNRVPEVLVLQDHGFGSNYDWFGRAGLLEEIAIKTNSYPPLMLVADNTYPWDGYSKIERVEHAYSRSGHLRFLFDHESGLKPA